VRTGIATTAVLFAVVLIGAAPATRPAARVKNPDDKADAQNRAAEQNAAKEDPKQAARPAARPAQSVAQNLLDSIRTSIRTAKDGGKRKPGELFELVLVNENLALEVRGDLTPQTRYAIEGMPGVWVVNVVSGSGRPPTHVGLAYYDVDARSPAPVMVALNASPGAKRRNFALVAQFIEGDSVAHLALSSSEGEATMRLQTQTVNRFEVRMSRTAPNLTELRRAHPEEVRNYLMPALMAVRAEDLLRPGPVEVYRTFTEIEPSPRIVEQLTELVERMDSPASEERDAAERAIQKLGRPGILAALRLDLDNLPAEPRSRLSLFLRQNTRWAIDDYAQARQDLDFLIDCLGDEDRAVRLAAKGQIEQLLGRTVRFDVDAEERTLQQNVVALRKEIARTHQKKNATENDATTRPARPAA